MPGGLYLAGNSRRYRSQAALAASRIAQSVERKTLNLVVVGSSPTLGALFLAQQGSDALCMGLPEQVQTDAALHPEMQMLECCRRSC